MKQVKSLPFQWNFIDIFVNQGFETKGVIFQSEI